MQSLFLASAGAMLSATTAAATVCQPLTWSEDFSGDFRDSWTQVAGAEHPDSLVQTHQGGLDFVLRHGTAASTTLVSKLQLYTGTVEFDMKTNAKEGVIYAFVVWPDGNVPGHGEIDLELLGGRDTDSIMCPLWAPGEDVPIRYRNQPSSWGRASSGGPIADFGDASPAGSQSWLTLDGFEFSENNRFALEIAEDSISWNVNNRPFGSFARGSDKSAWPVGDEALTLSFGLWANTTLSSWMGVYDFDAADPPTMSIANLSFSGCTTNADEIVSSWSKPRSVFSPETSAAFQVPDATNVSQAMAQPTASSQPATDINSEPFKTASSTSAQTDRSSDGLELWSSAIALSSSPNTSPASISGLSMVPIASQSATVSSAPVQSMVGGDSLSEAPQPMLSKAFTTCENAEESAPSPFETSVEAKDPTQSFTTASPHESSPSIESATPSEEEEQHAPDTLDPSSSSVVKSGSEDNAGVNLHETASGKTSVTLTDSTTVRAPPFMPPEPASFARGLPSGPLRGDGGAPVNAAAETQTALQQAAQDTELTLQPSEAEAQEVHSSTSAVQTFGGHEFVPDSSSVRVKVGTLVLTPFLLAIAFF